MRAKSRSIAKPKSKSSVSTRSRTGVKASSKASTKRTTGARGLVKAMSRIKGKSPLKSTSEMRAKRASSRKSPKSTASRPLRSDRRISTSTKPSLGRVDISEIQRTSVDERLSPQSDKPYTGADAFKPDAKGADTLLSAPPRKPIRQSRNQVGVRHH